MQLNDIKQIGVIGSGTMGFGIAINFALWGYPTMMSDLSDEILEQSMKNVRSAMALFVEGELITRQQADETVSRITPTTDVAELAQNSDFVTEAIVERSKDKRELFNKLDELCPPHTILASNTSGFVLSDFGSDVKRQDKIVLTHYFAPPHIVPGVEVAKGPETTDETYELTCDLMERVKKVPIRLKKELPGYLLNRIQGAMGREALQLWAEGMASAEDIELGIISTFGFRMPHEGPFMHYDLAGIWKWPVDAGRARTIENEKIRDRMSQRTPWFVDPQKFDEAVEKRDREYIRRLKELYWKEEV
ncbi:3-hydroxyacyl-CoA dehydrogenase family protein [Chloroflexi bacterium TSY]|nr:3-hydroxyacyl-CoA dehydrogenase family protein [Chloroflexi bacterium TSY]